MAKKLLFLVFLLALFVRLIKLDNFPLGFHADEVRVGWNAYSILKTSKDDLGNRFALYYNTFGDYRPTGIFYLTLPSLLIFGLSEFAVRYPSALIGALTVFPLYALTIQIQKNKRAALWAAIFLAFIPWHWMTSRATSEVVMSVFFALWGLVFFIKALKNNKNKHFAFSVVLILLSCLLYHSIRLLAPIFLITCLFFYWNDLSIETKKKAINTCIASVLIVGALLLTKGSLGRFQQVSITKTLSAPTVLGTHTSKTTLVSRVTTEYAKYFSADFLIGDAAKPYRYRVFGVSTLGIPLLLLFICGVITIIQKKSSALPLYLLILSPLPAAITMEDSPNLHRALFMLPFFLLIASDGYVHFIKRKGLKKVGVFLLITFFFLESTSAYLNYFRSGAYNAAPYRNVAAKDLILRVLGERNKYDHIVVTNDPDSPYPWFAFYGQLDPAEFNTHAIKRNEGPWNWQNVTFTQNKCPAGEVFEKDSPLKGNVLVIDAATCNKESIQKDIPTAKLVDEVTNPDGTTAYHMWEKPKF